MLVHFGLVSQIIPLFAKDFEMMMMPDDWGSLLAPMLAQPALQALDHFVAEERRTHTIYPPEDQVFAALRATPVDAVRVVILGQDPYHGPGQAHGLAFSVPRGVKLPPSLRNILKELRDDMGCPLPPHGDLGAWTRQGVLLLNMVLTVRDGEPGSHAGRGWEQITQGIVRGISARPSPVVFALWGRPAQGVRSLIDESRHIVLTSAHPSPLSAKRGFFGSRPFSRTNDVLSGLEQSPIEWCLPQT
jgi:uracil-DNA glycosylase